MSLGVLEKKCSLQASQLAYLADISHALDSEAQITRALQKLLLVLPEELSHSKTAIFTHAHNGSVLLKSYFGFEAPHLSALEQFYSHMSVLFEVVNERKVVNLPSHELPFDVNEVILKEAGIRSGVLVPLLSAADCMGVLFIGSEEASYFDSELENFIQTVGVQIGQSIALNTIFGQMKSTEMRYKSLLENASCSIFVADLQGIILETNKEGEKLLGCSKAEILGTQFKEYFTPEFKAQLAIWTKDLEDKKNLRHTEIQIQRKNGEIRTVDGSGVLVEIGDDQFIFMIGTDVTEMNQLRAKTLLHDKLATIGLLAAGVAHEINNPIACVLSNIEFIQEKLSEIKNKKIMISDEILSVLEEVTIESLEASTRVKEIVNDLNVYSRKDDVQIEPVDLHDVLDSAISMSLSECRGKAKITKNYDRNIPLLKLNRGKLHQVFLNLIVNAAQSIVDGKPELNKIIISSKLEKNKIIVSIEDTGKGIPSEVLPRIFDPFFTTKPIGEGTGLGLFICHEIITNMGGEMRVESKPVQGSIFLIKLPLSPNMLG